MNTNQDGGLFAGDRLSLLRSLIADDGFAMSFQSLGQYRTALLKPELPQGAQPATHWICAATPPDDEKLVLIALSDGEVWTGYRDGDAWRYVTADIIESARVTHWMDLPAAPESIKEHGQ
jgi:hypothetical protein